MPTTSPAPRLDPWGSGWVAVGFGIAALPIVLAAIFIAPEFLFGLAILAVLYGLLNALVDL